MRRFALLVGVAYFLTPAGAASAQQPGRPHYDLPAQELAAALRQVGQVAGIEIMFAPDDVAGRTAPRLLGDLTATEAINRLLAGTGLSATLSNGTIIIRGRSARPRPQVADAAESQPDIVVTGSHIRGAPPVAPVTTVTQEQARDAGQTTLGDVVRAIPQSFAGGQNPGVAGGGSQGGNENVNSASTINLRGLGADATLTLINGHRAAYNSIGQGVDVSVIPIVALDRIEIVADGASALYGSDAVGGVANIILKRDYDGVYTSARVGAATDGGGVQQQYDLVGGNKWGSGGFLVAGDYSRATAIMADDRPFTRNLDPSTTLLPPQEQVSAIVAGHQALGHGLRVEVDGQFNRRTSSLQNPGSITGSVFENGLAAEALDTAFALSPKLTLELPHRWAISLSGTYGEDRTHAVSRIYSLGALARTNVIAYGNQLRSVEVGTEGPLVRLPGGNLRLALGAGYRANTLTARIGQRSGETTRFTTDATHDRDSHFGYVELYAPLVSRAMAVPAVDQLSVTAAIRYEDYPGMARLATPKLGAIYAPVPDVSLKGSWGRSFKTPTLYQQYQAPFAALTNASVFGGTAYPRGATAILLSGGNPDLKPETATSWSATLDLHPRALSGLHATISYFEVAYRDRIVEPLTSIASALSNPIYRDLVSLDPTLAALDAIAASTPTGISNLSGRPYDPAAVVAVVDNRKRNSERQMLHGFDLAADYRWDVSSGETLTLSASASHLRSRQQLGPGQPTEALAGTIFRPPNWRARGGAVWKDETVTLAGYVNYIGPVRDDRYNPAPRVAGMTTLDLTARYRAPDRSPLRGLDLTLSCVNALNQRPATIRNTDPTDPTYDSTNYSAIGRFISFTVAKAW